MSASSRNAESVARPNAFFCVPVHDPAVLRTAAEVQAALAASEPRVDLRARGALTPLSSLHITLGTCRIDSEAERRAAVAIAADCAQRLHELVTDPLRLSGVRGFRDRVLYGAVAAPGATALTQVADELRGALDAAGLAAGNHEEFTAHMTLVKLPRALCREIGTLDTNSWWGMRDVDFGTQGVAGLHLCWMRTPGGPPPGATAHGGFYDTIASARFGRLVPQAAAAADSSLLDVYDFDGTLFETLGPAEGPAAYEASTGRVWPHRSWLDRPESIDVGARPRAALAVMAQSLATPTAKVVVLSARQRAVAEAISDLLQRHGVALPPESLLLRERGVNGDEHKVATLRALVAARPETKRVRVWEDSPRTLAAYASLSEEFAAVGVAPCVARP